MHIQTKVIGIGQFIAQAGGSTTVSTPSIGRHRNVYLAEADRCGSQRPQVGTSGHIFNQSDPQALTSDMQLQHSHTTLEQSTT